MKPVLEEQYIISTLASPIQGSSSPLSKKVKCTCFLQQMTYFMFSFLQGVNLLRSNVTVSENKNATSFKKPAQQFDTEDILQQYLRPNASSTCLVFYFAYGVNNFFFFFV